MQPFRELRWWKWMYYLSPYTYLVEALMGNGERSPLSAVVRSLAQPGRYSGLGGQQITCSDVEYLTVSPPPGMTCSQYTNPYIARVGGYVANLDSTSDCRFCPFRDMDEFLDLSFNIKYSNRWRDVGIFIGFIVLNVRDTTHFLGALSC